MQTDRVCISFQQFRDYAKQAETSLNQLPGYRSKYQVYHQTSLGTSTPILEPT